MMLERMHNIKVMVLRPSVTCLDLGNCRDDEAEMIQRLGVRGDCCGAMEREVVTSGTQVGVVGVGLPYHGHAEHAAIKFARPINVGHPQSQMP